MTWQLLCAFIAARSAVDWLCRVRWTVSLEHHWSQNSVQKNSSARHFRSHLYDSCKGPGELKISFLIFLIILNLHPKSSNLSATQSRNVLMIRWAVEHSTKRMWFFFITALLQPSLITWGSKALAHNKPAILWCHHCLKLFTFILSFTSAHLGSSPTPLRSGWDVAAGARLGVCATVVWEVRCWWSTLRTTPWPRNCRLIQTSFRHSAQQRIVMSWAAPHAVMGRSPSGRWSKEQTLGIKKEK